MVRKVKVCIVAVLGWISLILIPGLMFAQNNRFWSDQWVPWIGVPWTNQKQDDSLVHTIQTAINWVLWMLSFVALVLCLYAWFKMLTSWWDSKKYDAWLNILKNAAIWLAVIALSWLIVSLIFWIINGSIEPNIGEETTTSVVESDSNAMNNMVPSGPVNTSTNFVITM